MSARKIGLLLLLLGFGAAVETAWQVRGDVAHRAGGLPRHRRPLLRSLVLLRADRRAGAAARRGAAARGEERLRRRERHGRRSRRREGEAAQGRLPPHRGEGPRLRRACRAAPLRRRGAGEGRHQPRRDRPRPGRRLRDPPRDRGPGRDRGRDPQRARARRPRRAWRAPTSSPPSTASRSRGSRAPSSSSPGTATSARAGSAPAWSSPPATATWRSRTSRAPSKLDVEHGDLSARKTGPLDVAIQYGGFEAEGVAGDLVVRGGHAGVRASDVTGRAEVETSFAGIHLARVGGDVRAKAQHGEVTAEDVAGGLFAETTHDGCEARPGGRAGAGRSPTTAGSRRAASRRAPACARPAATSRSTASRAASRSRSSAAARASSPRAALAAEVTVSATQGEVRLEVPEGSRFDLDAESRRGELSTEVPGLTTSETGGEPGRAHRVAGQLAGGGVAVRLRADGDVTLEAKPAGPIADRAVAKPTAAAPAEATPAPAAAPVDRRRRPKPPRRPAGGGAATAGSAGEAGGARGAVSIR